MIHAQPMVVQDESPNHLVGLVKRKIFPSLKRLEQDHDPDPNDHDPNDHGNNSASSLEIFASNPHPPMSTMASTNSIVSSQDHDQSVLLLQRSPEDDQNLNLLPTNDLLDQIVHDTS